MIGMRDAYPGLMASSALAAIAAWIFLIGFGVIDVAHDAPGWIVNLIGIAALSAAAYLFSAQLPLESAVARIIRKIAGPAIFVVFVTVTHWIAFGPGERGGAESITLPVVGLSLPSQSDWVRAGFGFGAFVIDLLILRGLIHLLRAWRSPAGRDRRETPGSPGTGPT